MHYVIAAVGILAQVNGAVYSMSFPQQLLKGFVPLIWHVEGMIILS